MKKNVVYLGDSVQVLKDFEENSIDMVLTDPPYGISFMGREWDTVLPPREAFLEMFRVLKPGSWAFIMSSPRQDVFYRMMKMLEDVGFDIDFSSIYWTFGTGLPKSVDMGKLIDKKFGAERKVVGKSNNKIMLENLGEAGYKSEWDITLPSTEEAKHFDGWAGGFNVKPAVEVIIVAMKPITEKTYVDHALRSIKDDSVNPGAINIDAGRIPPNSDEKVDVITKRKPTNEKQVFNQENSGFKPENYPFGSVTSKGRFPANLLVSDNVLGDTFSRYFSLDNWWEKKVKELPEEVQKVFPFLNVPKPSVSEKKIRSNERNFHPTVKPVQLGSCLISLGSREGQLILDPFAGSGSFLVSAFLMNRDFIGIELEKEHYEIIQKRLEKYPIGTKQMRF